MDDDMELHENYVDHIQMQQQDEINEDDELDQQ